MGGNVEGMKMVEKVSFDIKHNHQVAWFQRTFPELAASMRQSSHHYNDQHLNPYHLEGDVLCHTMMVCLQASKIAPTNTAVKWAALLHDTGKPLARAVNEETKRVSFYGHGGISAFIAMHVLDSVDVTHEQRVHIHKLIACHDELFHLAKGFKAGVSDSVKLDISRHFVGDADLLHDLVYQSVADATGRFYQDGLDDVHYDELFKLHHLNRESFNVSHTGRKKKVTVLVGMPCSGKSTWCDEHAGDAIVVCRDDIIEQMGIDLGCDSYSSAWKKIHENAEWKNVLAAKFEQAMQNASRSDRDVVIDMTNMTRTGRRGIIHRFNKHSPQAVVFLTGIEESLTRNHRRREETGKYVPPNIFVDMARRYSLPMYFEGFDNITFV